MAVRIACVSGPSGFTCGCVLNVATWVAVIPLRIVMPPNTSSRPGTPSSDRSRLGRTGAGVTWTSRRSRWPGAEDSGPTPSSQRATDWSTDGMSRLCRSMEGRVKDSTRRSIVRWIHLVFSIPILGYIYSPFEEIPKYADRVRFVVVPVMLLSGLWMWKGHVLRRLIWKRSA
jgi:hypothetical protein